ncbi:MAG: hypothetical protein FWD69_19620, partial [Polyangiaceae bacterium]|nr:hypothetical protein [Polyangiaceae bacterium]
MHPAQSTKILENRFDAPDTSCPERLLHSPQRLLHGCATNSPGVDVFQHVDAYLLLEYLLEHKKRFVVRATHKRKVTNTDGDREPLCQVVS